MSFRAHVCAALLLAALAPDAGAEQDLFIDATAASGLGFVYFNGMSGEHYLVEMMGGGAALFDYDRDGDLDAYFVQGEMLPSNRKYTKAIFPPQYPLPLTGRLYRNDSAVAEDGYRHAFTDVTAEAGLKATGYGNGVAAADIDNDGYIDLYVMNYGANALLRNRGDGTFEDITAKAGVADPGWSVSASFVDYDRDGLLDLYVGNYLEYDIANTKPCLLAKRIRDYCGARYQDGQRDTLYRNLGNGRFADVSESSGIARHYGGALGVIAADFDGDEWPDIYVANDGVANILWINQRDGTFRDEALLAGVAVNRDGMTEGSMGVDAQDFDADGDMDIFITHFNQETNTLYVNDGAGWFEDESVARGIATPSFRFTGFGTAWFDVDNDGWLDLYSANGAVTKKEALVRAGEPYPLHETNQLFLGSPSGEYREVTALAGAALGQSRVSRGAAFGDVDNDGDSDILVVNNAGAAQLLINQAGQSNSWLGLDLVAPDGRNALGSVAVLRNGNSTLVRRARTDGSYASANDPRILFGLGASNVAAHDVEIRWPDGSTERFNGLAARRYHELRQGKGQPVKDGTGE